MASSISFHPSLRAFKSQLRLFRVRRREASELEIVTIRGFNLQAEGQAAGAGRDPSWTFKIGGSDLFVLTLTLADMGWCDVTEEWTGVTVQ